MAGDCYQANGNFIITKMGDNDFKLCHGVALLASDKKPFGHCWIEKGGGTITQGLQTGSMYHISLAQASASSTTAIHLFK